MPEDQPLPVALALVENDDGELLLVKREGGDFPDLWGLPGGKIERDEFVAEAIEREVLEETGVATVFREHRGIVSEHVMEGGSLVKHVPIHVCLLDMVDGDDLSDRAEWMAPEQVRAIEDETVPSLRPIVEAYLDGPGTRYHESVIVRENGNVRLDRFE